MMIPLRHHPLGHGVVGDHIPELVVGVSPHQVVIGDHHPEVALGMYPCPLVHLFYLGENPSEPVVPQGLLVEQYHLLYSLE